MRERVIEHGIDLCFACHVGRVDNHVDSGPGDFVGRITQGRFAARNEYQTASFAGEGFGNAQSDPFAGSSDEANFANEFSQVVPFHDDRHSVCKQVGHDLC